MYENRCFGKNPEENYLRTDAPKNKEKKLNDNRCSEKSQKKTI